MFILYQARCAFKGSTTLVVLSKENEVFGELSLLMQKNARQAPLHKQIVCCINSRQLPFFELIEVRPEIVMGAIKILSKRLRDQNEKTRANEWQIITAIQYFIIYFGLPA